MAEPARRPQKSRFRQLVSGLGHGDVGTPYFFHTFQRRSNRGRATILDGSLDGDEIPVKGKSLIPLTSGAPTGTANGSNLQSETPPLKINKKQYELKGGRGILTDLAKETMNGQLAGARRDSPKLSGRPQSGGPAALRLASGRLDAARPKAGRPRSGRPPPPHSYHRRWLISYL